jgi:hypothetical protein
MSRKVEHIDGNRLVELFEEVDSYQFLDVRSPMEYNSGNIDAFSNIPLQELQQNIETLEKDKPVVVICESGSRSVYAARILSKVGFEKILNVRGGMSALR